MPAQKTPAAVPAETLVIAPNSSKEITLEQWALLNDVSHRTACGWADQGKIPAKKKRVKQEVTRTTTVTKYMIRANAKKPKIVK